jgi:hypothetical protein
MSGRNRGDLELELARLLCETTLTESEARRELNFPKMGSLFLDKSRVKHYKCQDFEKNDPDDRIDWDGVVG